MLIDGMTEAQVNAVLACIERMPNRVKASLDLIKQYGPVPFYKTDIDEQRQQIGLLADVIHWQDKLDDKAHFFGVTIDTPRTDEDKQKFVFWRYNDAYAIGCLLRIRLAPYYNPQVRIGPMVRVEESAVLLPVINQLYSYGTFKEGEVGYQHVSMP